MRVKIRNARLVLPDAVLTGRSLYLEDARIASLTAEDLPSDDTWDAAGLYVAPGFIDLHVHGGGGADCMDGTVAAVRQAARFHLRHGTTTLYPTTLAASDAATAAALASIRAAMGDVDGPRIPGAHIEGLYFAPAQSGAQDTAQLRVPVEAEYAPLLREYGDVIRRWSFAPELPGTGAFLRALTAQGIVAAAAHTDAVYSDMERAYRDGCRLVTHLYSCMSTVTRQDGFRRAGVVEAAYLLPDMAVEMIADGCHLPPELLRLIHAIKEADRVCLVTDAMRCTGTAEREAFIGPVGSGTACIIEDGVAKLPDRRAFAGSIATADRLVRTCVAAGIPLPDAVTMMTGTPARVMGLGDRGRLLPGQLADLVFFDDAITVKRVVIGGSMVWDLL